MILRRLLVEQGLQPGYHVRRYDGGRQRLEGSFAGAQIQGARVIAGDKHSAVITW